MTTGLSAHRAQSGPAVVGTVALLFVLVLPVAAHEFWVTPSGWVVQPGARVMILANVGDQFPDANSYTTPERIETIRLVGPVSDTLVNPPYRREKDSLAADLQVPSRPGTYVGVVIVKPRVGEKSGPVFQAHIAHQGLDEVGDYRAKHGRSRRPTPYVSATHGTARRYCGSGATVWVRARRRRSD